MAMAFVGQSPIPLPGITGLFIVFASPVLS